MQILEPISLTSALLAFTAYLALSFWILSKGHLHEDAYILFTYAEHLANGDGIVYFTGGEHAEGATDFLWMVFLAFLTYFGLDVGRAAALLNGVGIGLIVYLLTQNLHWADKKWSKLAAGIFLALLLVTSKIADASVSGFSTAVYASIYVLIIHLYINAPISVLKILPLLSLLLGLIRPDGVIMGVFATLIGIERIWNTKYRSAYLYAIATASILGIFYFVWRLNYFGHLLPLPLYVKSYSEHARPGLYANLFYLRSQATLIVIALLTIVLVRDVKRYLLSFLPVIALLTGLMFVYQSQNVANRFQAPVTAALLFAFALFLSKYLKDVVTWKRITIMTMLIPIIAISTRGSLNTYKYLTNTDYINYFPFLVSDIVPQKTKIALTEAGRFAYWIDAQIYDLVGLNTTHIAINKLNVTYLQDLEPDIIFIHTADTLEPFPENNNNTIETSVDFIDQYLVKKVFWKEVQNPVKRAPYVVYEYLRNNRERYNLVFARYGDRFFHLYAVKRDSEVNWLTFTEMLNASFSKETRMSYLEMKLTEKHDIR